MQKEQCPICEQGSLTEISFDNVIEFRGRSRAVTCKAATCSACGVDQAGAKHLRLNKNAVLRFYAEVEYGTQASNMPTSLMSAIYEKSASPRGPARHFWATKVARLRGRNRLPRGLFPVQVFV